jgi:hypothetical protein
LNVGPSIAEMQCKESNPPAADHHNIQAHLLPTTTVPPACTSCCMNSAAKAAGLSRCANQRASVHLACTGRSSHCDRGTRGKHAGRSSKQADNLKVGIDTLGANHCS